jgi:alkylation response protein AidB-like acyl-CoA dehydrogenase
VSIGLERPSITEADRRLRADLVGRVAGLVPLLRENAQRTEDERRVIDENLAAIEAAGLFAISQPKRFGGLEVDFRTKLEVVRELARGCGSTAWTVGLLTDGSWLASMWNEQAQKDIWGDSPTNLVAGVVPPSGEIRVIDSGYRVSGRWANCSGCLHAQWILLGTPPVTADGQEIEPGLVLVPVSQVKIDDTWFMSGMKGTGSHTVVADDVFVPAHRFLSTAKLVAGENDNPYKDELPYRVPFIPTAIVTMTAPHLGLARAALDLVIEKAAKRGISYTFYEVQKDAPTVQLAVAKAASLADTAELLAYRAAGDTDEAAQQGTYPDYATRARIRMDAVQAIVYAREAIRELIGAHGSAAFSDTHPLQRIWRDCEVASRHAIANPAIGAEIYGRSLLGINEGVTPLV